MTKFTKRTPALIGRRGFLGAAGACRGRRGHGRPFRAGGAPLRRKFPSRNIDIIIPTGEGGGADRDARAFASVWGNHLPTNFQFGYYPGAAGQVGYEFYMSREPDAHSLIFANLGPEVIMLALQDTGISVGEDIVYIQQTLSEPMAVWVGPSSPFRTLEELVEEGRRRPLTVAVSRLPHPALHRHAGAWRGAGNRDRAGALWRRQSDRDGRDHVGGGLRSPAGHQLDRAGRPVAGARHLRGRERRTRWDRQRTHGERGRSAPRSRR